VKKLIRLIIKIPVTPFITVFYVMMIMVPFIFQFFEWLYEADSSDKNDTFIVRKYLISDLKRWFTTI